jgi:prepilin-type N-terminal cleavage/methylation domain-containing protein
MTRRGFSLIEMLVATVLFAVLMWGVLAMLAGVSRDRRMINALNAAAPATGTADLFQFDLANARSFSQSDDQSIVLIGVGGIDDATLVPNGRLVQVTYKIQSAASTKNLWRVQQYLDDPARPQVWQELVTANVSSFSVDPNPGPESPVPSRVRLRLASSSEGIDQNLWIK